MALQQDPRNGIYYDWDQGASFKTEQDQNLRKIGSILNVSAIDFTATPPGSPSDGDTHIVAATGATGDFVGQENNIAIWFNDDSQWRFFTPTTGLTAFITTGTFANQLVAYNGTSWSTNGFTFTF